MVQLKIQNTNGDPVVLDKFTVILTDSNRDITQDLLFDAPIDGYYPIIDDNFREEAHSSHLKVQFTGIINDAIVVQENYVIEADCCHINLVSGKTGITI